jgi:hypothetical protein
MTVVYNNPIHRIERAPWDQPEEVQDIPDTSAKKTAKVGLRILGVGAALTTLGYGCIKAGVVASATGVLTYAGIALVVVGLVMILCAGLQSLFFQEDPVVDPGSNNEPAAHSAGPIPSEGSISSRGRTTSKENDEEDPLEEVDSLIDRPGYVSEPDEVVIPREDSFVIVT